VILGVKIKAWIVRVIHGRIREARKNELRLSSESVKRNSGVSRGNNC